MSADLISRKALINILEDVEQDGLLKICQIIELLEDQPKAYEDAGWIPVEERMPEDGTYLCTLDGELCGIKEPFTGMCGIENGIWDEPDCVIAWRPLPEPYKPESN